METVDESSCAHPAVALDSRGLVHVSYLREGEAYLLRYATNRSGNWTSDDLDVTRGLRDWIAVDVEGRAHVVCTSGRLHYLTNSGGTWSSEIVDQRAWNGISVGVDLTGNVQTVYIRKPDSEKSGQLVHNVRIGSRWESTYIDAVFRERGDDVGFVLDAQGHAHVAYYDDVNRALKYATNGSGTWETRMVASVGRFVGGRPAICIDSKKRVHLLFGDQEGFVLRHAVYGVPATLRAISATADSRGSKVEVVETLGDRLDRWVVTDLQPVGNTDCAAAIDGEDAVHVAWLTGGALMYGRLKDGSWETHAIDPDGGRGGGHQSMAVDGSGNVHVVYCAREGGALKYARSSKR